MPQKWVALLKNPCHKKYLPASELPAGLIESSFDTVIDKSVLDTFACGTPGCTSEMPSLVELFLKNGLQGGTGGWCGVRRQDNAGELLATQGDNAPNVINKYLLEATGM